MNDTRVALLATVLGFATVACGTPLVREQEHELAFVTPYARVVRRSCRTLSLEPIRPGDETVTLVFRGVPPQGQRRSSDVMTWELSGCRRKLVIRFACDDTHDWCSPIDWPIPAAMPKRRFEDEDFESLLAVIRKAPVCNDAMRAGAGSIRISRTERARYQVERCGATRVVTVACVESRCEATVR